MSSSRKKSIEPFRYDKELESKIGKRTGAYVRKSNIAKDFDGLHAMSDYWETTTEKTFGTADDLETSMTSDIYVEQSDGDYHSSRGSSPKSKGSFGISARRRRMLQLSSQKATGIFEDVMNGSQAAVPYEAKDSSYIQPLKSFKRDRPSPIENDEFENETEEEDSLLRGLSASKSGRSFISNMTHITRTPSVSISAEEESAKKNLDDLMKSTDAYSEYYHRLKEDKSMDMMRSHLKKIQDSESQGNSNQKAHGRYSESPVDRKLNLSFLDEDEKGANKGNKGGKQPKRQSSAHEEYPGDEFFTQVSGNKNAKNEEEEPEDDEEESPEKKQPEFMKYVTKRNGNKVKDTTKEQPKDTKKSIEPRKSVEPEATKKENEETQKKKVGRPSKDAASKARESLDNEEPNKTIKNDPKKSEQQKPPIKEETISKENKRVKNSAITKDEQDLKDIIQKSLFERLESSKQVSKNPSAQSSAISKQKTNPDDSPARKKKIEIPKKDTKKTSSPPPNKFNNDKLKSSDEKKRLSDPKKSGKSKDDKDKNKDSDKGKKVEKKTKSPSPKSKVEHRRQSNSPNQNFNDYGDYGADANFDDQQYSNRKSRDQSSEKKNKKKTPEKNMKPKSPKRESKKSQSPDHGVLKKVKKSEKSDKEKSKDQRKIKVELKKSRSPSRDKSKDPSKSSKSKHLKRYEEKSTKNRKRKRRDRFIEAYEISIGANDLHLVEQKIEPSRTEFFAGGRYPIRHRLPKLCFWKNERPVYSNLGHGIEIVGFMFDGEARTVDKISKVKTKPERGSSEKKKLKKLEDHERSKSLKDDKQNKVVRKMFEEDESDQENEISIEEQRLPALDKMNFDYKVISEDKETITVFLKLKPGNEKEPQKNVAGTMQCTVIKCEDGKAEAMCADKKYTLALNDKFVIPSKSVYSIKNKSKYKDLEISCHILK